jgi:hypothetical protein
MLLAAGRSVSTEISSHEVLLFIICFALGGAAVVILLPKKMRSQAQSRLLSLDGLRAEADPGRVARCPLRDLY